MKITTSNGSHEVFSKKDIRVLPEYKKIRKQLPKDSKYVGLRFSKLYNGTYAIKVTISQNESMYDLYLAIAEENPSNIGIKSAREILKIQEVGDC